MWILYWKYCDNSGVEFIGAFDNVVDADLWQANYKKHGDPAKEYLLSFVEVKS